MRRTSTLVGVLLVLTLISCGPWRVWSSSLCKQTNLEVRPHSVSITEFGAVGDGVTLNTKAFQNAIFYLNSFADKGGAKLFVPAGRWLTGSFDLISHLTLWLDKDAVILGSTNPDDWPVVDPLPSYGRGRELPGGRHKSLIYGQDLTDVVITGNNGTIDGQGSIWWSLFRNKTLDYTRPHLVELMNSAGVLISNLTFLDSPFWNIHPVYCSQVTVKKVKILAPLDSPNTDGIDPDSSDNVCIEDCYISTGDDLIAIKSGWDEYGIAFGRPSTNIIINRLTGRTATSAGIAIGSEMSGGVSEVHAQDIRFFDSYSAIRIKTSPGRGGYVRNVFVSNMTLENVDIAIRFTGTYGDHPDDKFDPNALPLIEKITIKDVIGQNIKRAGLLEGIEGDNFVNICLSNIILNVSSSYSWNCSNVQGYSDFVSPEACKPLKERIFPEHCSDCYNLSNHLQSSNNQTRGAWLLSCRTNFR
ncbi:probable polygalacturonase isoform X2 [Arachis stenosperma]|uniref:probable polygalacturonase isoform X1 n=1 Tax=Arachis hypogaea TaxID=3818 RepID=UPI000DEC802E|nr:probable polygalacturonase isoform X1 [Arachis hypogaea]XP_025661765.1 probable polygalacturonase isoform X1 [Arachis hypogaea]XP_057721535.1 probable polygalacturonase isoform X2 [Arachis stenosperma]